MKEMADDGPTVSQKDIFWRLEESEVNSCFVISSDLSLIEKEMNASN